MNHIKTQITAHIDTAAPGQVRVPAGSDASTAACITAPSRLYWVGRPTMSIVQALHWPKDTLPADRPRIVKRLYLPLDGLAQGDAIHQDLPAGFNTLPAWV